MRGFHGTFNAVCTSDERDLWLVNNQDGSFCYETPVGATHAPKHGFITDFASIPAAFAPLGFPKHGKYDYAAVIHDWLYTQATTTRAYADGVFLAAMQDCGVPWWQRNVMYYAVRTFGASHFCKPALTMSDPRVARFALRMASHCVQCKRPERHGTV